MHTTGGCGLAVRRILRRARLRQAPSLNGGLTQTSREALDAPVGNPAEQTPEHPMQREHDILTDAEALQLRLDQITGTLEDAQCTIETVTMYLNEIARKVMDCQALFEATRPAVSPK